VGSPLLRRSKVSRFTISRLPESVAPVTGYVPVRNASLHYREIGQGPPLIVLHGGPDFSYAYLLPELDCLSNSFRLLYYDQRGRGLSAEGVSSEDVTLDSEMEDLEAVGTFFRLGSFALLGHSWGGVLAMEYAIRHPDHVSHLILMHPAPASQTDFATFQRARRETSSDPIAKMKALAATAEYESGDIEVDADYYRHHFRATLPAPEDLERVVGRLRQGVTPEVVRTSREIENRLYEQTWDVPGYDLLPKLKGLRMPALVLHGERDMIPRSCVERIATAIPGARFVVLERCGHFAYFERPDAVRDAIVDFMGAGTPKA